MDDLDTNGFSVGGRSLDDVYDTICLTLVDTDEQMSSRFDRIPF